MHCIHDITPTISEMASTITVSSQWLYRCSQTNSMTSQPLYVCHLMHSTQCHTHSLRLHTIVVITLYLLHSWHHTPYISHHTHGNTNVISAIWSTVSNTTSTVSVSSHPLYWWYHAKWISEISPAIYDNIISIVYDITATECLSSHSLFQRYNTLCL